jgi:hypothetical protein
MAKKGTFTAYQQLTPIKEDFGQIAKEDKANFDKERALKKQEDKDAQAEVDKLIFNPLGDQQTGVETLDDALYNGIRKMNKLRYDDWKRARNDPSYAKSDEYLAKTANRANYAKNLKVFTDKYAEYAKGVTDMGGKLSGWNADAMKEVNAFFNEEKVMFKENKYGEPIAMIAVIDPETGQFELNEDGSQKYTESSLAQVMKGTGIYDIVPEVNILANVKSIGDILGDDLKDVKKGWTITTKQEWASKEEGARSLVESELGSSKNPTALAKRLWADEMGNSKANWNEDSFKAVSDKMLEKVKATYDEKLKIAYNYSGENAAAGRAAKKDKDTIRPVITPDSNTGAPVIAKIPGLTNNESGYSVSFGDGVLTSKTEGSSELIDNVWVTEDGEMYATKKKATKASKDAVSVLDENGEIDNAKLVDIVLGGGGSSSGWKVEEVTEKVSETEFTNLAKNRRVKNEQNKHYKDGKELKDDLKNQWRAMPKGGELNSVGEPAKDGTKTGELDEL